MTVVNGNLTALGWMPAVLGWILAVLGWTLTVLGWILTVLGWILTVLDRIMTVLVAVRELMNGELRGRDARAQHLPRAHVRVAERQAAKRLTEVGKRKPGIEEGAQRHVARQAREAIEVQHSAHN
jgi:hypothetical protein